MEDDPNDPVTVYVREVADVQPLTADEEAELFRQLGGSGNWDEQRENIARRLIESRLALVVRVARKHSIVGVQLLDLIQEGNIGLMNAVRSFAERPAGDFTDHATVCIEEAIARVFGKSQ